MKEKLIQFMQGRYGIDTLNNHALFFVIALFILNIFFNNRIIMSLGYLIYRMFSRQTYKRYQENEKYLKAIKPVQQFFNLQKKRFSDRSHKYYRCPSCKQMVRLPKGKGKIIVTCPSCHQKFEKRT
nr:hypothetical protein [uncultured Faecalibacillus sp.]